MGAVDARRDRHGRTYGNAAVILVTGKGTSGSWAIRGQQLGAAVGAVVAPQASREQIEAADIAVVVKRLPDNVRYLRRWVWDLVDFFPQPNLWSREEGVAWVRAKIAQHKPTGVIFPNQKMASDCRVPVPHTVIYHHHRPGIVTNPIREQVKTVGYEGCTDYLAEYGPVLLAECSRRSWAFTVNPRSLADLDIVVAVRGGKFAGYLPVNWKSNVKLANAHGSGTPFVGNMEAGYAETKAGGEYWVASPADIAKAFDTLEPQATRLAIRERFLQSVITVESCAGQLRAFLDAL